MKDIHGICKKSNINIIISVMEIQERQKRINRRKLYLMKKNTY